MKFINKTETERGDEEKEEATAAAVEANRNNSEMR